MSHKHTVFRLFQRFAVHRFTFKLVVAATHCFAQFIARLFAHPCIPACMIFVIPNIFFVINKAKTTQHSFTQN